MARFSFLHAADLHLDTPFSGVGRVDARLAETLRDATIGAFDRLVTAATERSVAFVVIAGDVYDGPERGVRARLAFRDGLLRLARAGIPSFIVHGNHDPVEEGWSAIRAWPEGITVFGAGGVTTFPVQRGGQVLALVHGISYAQRSVTENLALRFKRAPEECFQVGVLHCNAGANGDHAPYSPCSVEDLVARGLDYWALGHVHTRQFLREGKPWIAYPGNIQGLSPKPAERGAKGALLTSVDDDRVTSIEFLPLDIVRFDECELDVSRLIDLVGLVDSVVEVSLEQAATHEGRTVVLRVSLTGRGAVHQDLRRGTIRESVLLPARAALKSATQNVWLDVIDDYTRPDLDIEELRGRGDFGSDLVAMGDSALADPTARSALLAPYLDDLPRGDLRRLLGDMVEAAPTDDEVRSSLEAALDRVTEVE